MTNAGPKTGLPFNNGYTNYGHSYEGPYYSKINNECILGGLIGGGNGNNHVGTLPAGCRPRQGLLFNVNNHQCTMRLHVATDGRIHRETGHCHAWTSLAGVTFPASEATKTTLQLSNGWKGYGGYWGTPYYSLIKGECIVQGLISGNKWGYIATLPEICRPMKRLIFNLNNHQYTSRVDVLPNGQIHWISGGAHHGWLSLTGIRFEALPPLPPVVSIKITPGQVTSKEFNFDIRVSHAVCSTSSCFESSVQKDANVAMGLNCKAFIQPVGDNKCNYGNAKAHMPCKKWDNFFDGTKASDVQTYLSLTDKDDQLATGKYEILYNCYYGEQSQTKFKSLHTFTVMSGCSDWLPTSFRGLSIVELFLQSAPAFLDVKPPECDQIDRVKESIFREFDTFPLDGKLSAAEIRDAFFKHDVDATYLDRLIEEDYFEARNGGIMMSDVISSRALPLACTGTTLTDASDVFFTKSTYPTMQANEAECESSKEGVTLEWDFKRVPSTNDLQCLYTDGQLLRAFKTDSKKKSVQAFKDERPSAGVGEDAVKLVTQLPFDVDLKNSVDNSGASTLSNVNHGYITSSGCVTATEDGGKCFKRTSHSTAFVLNDQKAMSKSSIMTWVRLSQRTGGDQYLWFAMGYDSKDYQKSFGIDASGHAFAQLNAKVKVTGSKVLEVDEWYHVAMNLNKQTGLSIYVDGTLDKSLESIDNIQMDFPFVASSVKILDALGTFDDFRIYSGLLSKLHISSVYQCGRRTSCAQLARATPQSRRVYCIVPSYNTEKMSSGFTPPCVAGLYYNGAAIDLQLSPTQKGVLFSFRDTALEELSYEILRRPNDAITGPLGNYKAVVMIDSALDYCATTFSSLTFFDDEAIKLPGKTWEYAIKTKFKGVTKISDPRSFVTPFYAMFEGKVVAGKSGVPVPNVRVCTRLLRGSQSSSSLIDRDASDINLAAYMNAWHSEQEDPNKRSSAYKVTDQDISSYSELEGGEWFNVTLSLFSKIDRVNVCSVEEKVELDVRVLDYSDPKDEGDLGAPCILEENYADGYPILFNIGSSICRTYDCRGTKVDSYLGKVVTVKSVSSSSQKYHVSEIQVMGVDVDCPYTSFSDEDGNYEIDVLDLSGQTMRKAYIGTVAFKTDVFDEIDTLMVNATGNKNPESFLIALSLDEDLLKKNWETYGNVMSDADALCYRSKYSDIKKAYGDDLEKIKSHYDKHGSWEGRSYHGCNPTAELGSAIVPRMGADYEIEWKTGISFNSVPYPRTPSLYHGWNGYGHHYGYYPTVWVNDGVCVVEGLLSGHHWGHIGNLPGDCRPSGREIFNMNNHQYTSRVDVLSNG
ncbi:MAG TPA: hypothetical protein DCS80_04275, partial [Betaproteobacteria bacterium]|nr:hypothetical protein [Betaproteobacteria bacterium]